MSQQGVRQRARLLKPSWALRIAVSIFVLMPSLAAAFIFRDSGWILLGVTLVGLAPIVLVEPIAELITKRAEAKRFPPSRWFKIDIKREQQFYGPLRARRLFGHPLGGGKN